MKRHGLNKAHTRVALLAVVTLVIAFIDIVIKHSMKYGRNWLYVTIGLNVLSYVLMIRDKKQFDKWLSKGYHNARH